MTNDEYKYKLQVIETEYLESKKQLCFDYAASQRLFKIGDVIKDITGTIIEIQKFGAYMDIRTPKPTYIGRELRKDLQPKKNGEIRTIYGNNNIELLKSSVNFECINK